MALNVAIKIINMKNSILYSIIFCFIGIKAFGQSPTWVVNENKYQYTMSFIGFLNDNGVELKNVNDKVAAFVNGECRGVANLTYVASKDSYYAYLTVFSNTNGEVINFKIYNSVNNVVKEVVKTKVFAINEHFGNLFQAYSFASPALKTSAQITEFGFSGVVNNDFVIEGSQITVYIDKSQDLSALNAIFTLSPGAHLYLGTVKQVSGTNSLNFSNPIQFQVVSEDQSIAQQWTVVVKLSTGTATYYKKDAVCYQGGVIKVVFAENNAEVILLLNGITKATQTINNGQAIFDNLEVGTYTVKVGGNVKTINIKQKQ